MKGIKRIFSFGRPRRAITNGSPSEKRSQTAPPGLNATEKSRDDIELINKGETSVNLNDRSLNGEDAVAIAEALKVSTTLNKLTLSNNQIGDVGVSSLAGAMRVNKSLQRLYLNNNRIGDAGAISLAGGMEINKSLQRLYLNDNQIGNAGAISLADSLIGNTSLETLVLSNNKGITDTSLPALKALLQNSSITTINVDGTSISAKGKDELNVLVHMDVKARTRKLHMSLGETIANLQTAVGSRDVHLVTNSFQCLLDSIQVKQENAELSSSLLSSGVTVASSARMMDTVPVIVEAVQTIKDPKITLLGTHILQYIVIDVENQPNEIAKVLVETRKRHEGFFQEACEMLAKLIEHAENHSQLIQEGVLDELCARMRSTGNGEAESAVIVLNMLSLLLLKENRCLSIKGVINDVIKMMKNYPDNTQVQKQAWEIIQIIAKDEQTHTNLIENGVVDLIVQSANAHPENWELGDALLGVLAYSNPFVLSRVRELGAKDIFMKALDSNITHDKFQLDPPLRISDEEPAPDLSSLLDMMETLKDLEDENRMDIFQWNLQLFTKQHHLFLQHKASQIDQTASNAMKLGSPPDIILDSIHETERSIKNAEAYLGEKMLTKELVAEKPDWKTQATTRDESRLKFVSRIKEITDGCGELPEIYQDATKPDVSKLILERSMSEFIELLKSREKRASALPQTKRTHHICSPENWFEEFELIQKKQITESRQKLISNLVQLRTLIKETESSVRAYCEILAGVQDQMSKPDLELVLGEARDAMKAGETQCEEYAKKADFWRDKAFMKSFDVEREREHHERRIELGRLTDQIEQLTKELKHKETESMETSLNLNKNEETLTEPEKEKLQSIKQDIEAQIQVLKREQEGIHQRIILLSRSFSSSFVTKASAPVENEGADDKFDFPEAPLVAKMVSTSGKAKKNTKTEIVITMLQKSGFFTERSLETDYILLNKEKNIDAQDFPDEVKEIAQLDEVQASSVEIAQLKGTHDQSILGSIKVLQPIELTEFKTIRAAVLLSSRTRHPSILPIEAVFADEHRQKVFIQTPFRIGGSMKRWLLKSPRPLERKLDVLSKAADALDAIHKHGVVHRDIKLENIVMDSNEDNATPAICDFDASRDVTGAFGGATTTMAGGKNKIGTVRYMAPEIFEGQGGKATRESDVWSFVMICLVALVYDGNYEKMPMLEGRQNQGRVDIGKALVAAKAKLVHASNKHLLDLFERVLNGKVSTQRPSMEEIKDMLVNADMCECVLCKAEMSDFPNHRRIEGCECDGGEKHFYCRKHFREMVFANAKSGEVRCMECGGGGAGANPIVFSEKAIFECAGADALSEVLKGREAKFQLDMQTRIQGAQIEGEKKGKEAALKEAIAMSMLQIKVAQIRVQVENIALPQCPRCKVAVEHGTGCAAMKCANCECRFCMFCLTDCGNDAHDHVRVCPFKPDFENELTRYGSPEESRVAMTRKIKQDLRKFWNDLPDDDVKREAAKDPTVKGWMDEYQVVL